MHVSTGDTTRVTVTSVARGLHGTHVQSSTSMATIKLTNFSWCLQACEHGPPNGAAFLANCAWHSLSTIQATLSPPSSPTQPYLSPVVFGADAGLERLDTWLADQADRLTHTERALYSPSSSVKARRQAFQQLCQQQADLVQAREAMADWQTGRGGCFAAQESQRGPTAVCKPDLCTVIALHPRWVGHVPWALLLPGREQHGAAEVSEHLLVGGCP